MIQFASARFATALAFLGLALSAHAGITTYTDRTAYLGALGKGLNVFQDDFGAYQGVNFATRPLDANGFTIVGQNAKGNADAGGGRLSLYVSRSDSQSFLVRPDVPSLGFGADFGSAASASGIEFVVSLTGGAREIVPVTVNTGFFGFLSTETYSSFQIAARDRGGSVTSEAFTLDDSVVASPVPEPASMLALGLGILGLARRVRNTAE